VRAQLPHNRELRDLPHILAPQICGVSQGLTVNPASDISWKIKIEEKGLVCVH